MRSVIWLALAGWALSAPTQALGQVATKIRVRVAAHDAKVIGEGVGGARVQVKDVASGNVLAEGIQRGGTGSTSALAVNPIPRGELVYEADGAAVFTADLTLSEPTVLEFVGEGPLDYDHAMQRATKTMLVVPGEDILGNGVVLELNGFIVELLETEQLDSSHEVGVEARVRMMCGCTLEPDGLWDASRVKVAARLHHEGELIRELRLSYAGEPSVFRGVIPIGGVPTGATLDVLASDPTRGNFGRSQAIILP
jgi:hypothetical protein